MFDFTSPYIPMEEPQIEIVAEPQPLSPAVSTYAVPTEEEVPLEEVSHSYPDHNFGGIPHKSNRFWFEDGTVVIKVNDTLYKLYKGIFTQQSEYLRSSITAVVQSPTIYISNKKYSTPTYGDPRLVGIGSESEPLVLEVKRADFELLLAYMFPKDYNSQNTFTVSEWASIAAVSKTLEMTSVREAAITNILKTTDPLDLIDAGKKHYLTQCSSEGFRRLCVREDSLSLEEGQRLGLRSVIAIACGRDLLSRDSRWSEIEKTVLMEAGMATF